MGTSGHRDRRGPRRHHPLRRRLCRLGSDLFPGGRRVRERGVHTVRPLATGRAPVVRSKRRRVPRRPEPLWVWIGRALSPLPASACGHADAPSILWASCRASWHILGLDRTRREREREGGRSRRLKTLASPEEEGRRNTMRGLMPWTGMSGVRQEMDRMFDRFLEGRWDEFPTLGDWTPHMDVSETKDSLVVKVEVPGMDPKDIHLALQDNLLTIKGEKRHEKEEKDEHYRREERAYGAFARSLRLPLAVDASKVTASFKNGLLTVTLPKSPSARGTTIPIKAEQ